MGARSIILPLINGENLEEKPIFIENAVRRNPTKPGNCIGVRTSDFKYYRARNDAKKIDFSDAMIYEELNKTIKDRTIPMQQIMRDEALKAFDLWDKKEDKVKY